MLCKNCKDGFYGQAFDFTKCKRCGAEVVTEHMPGHLYCDKCSEEFSVCAQCGRSFYEQMTFEDLKED